MNIDMVLDELERTLTARKVDRYREPSTINYTYETPKLPDSAWSGRRAVQLQLGAHRHSETRAWQVTLGSPLVAVYR